MQYTRTMRDLIDGYFVLRQDSAGLKKQSPRFEGLPWRQEDDKAVREAGKWKLSVYRLDDGFGVTVYRPDGTFDTYS